MSPETTTPCPRCAVAVPLGYVKCPRCHAAMPAAGRVRRESSRDLMAGGTAVPGPEGSGVPWLLAAVGAVAAIAAIVWYVESGGARAAETGATAAPVTGSAAMVAPAPAAVAPRADVEPPPAPKVDPRPRQRAEALAALEHALDSDQLWATVTATGDDVVIRSSFCADRGIAARADAVRDQLGALGFHAVRCLEKGGAPVWNRDLPAP